MKLYLSSFRMGNHTEKLLEMAGGIKSAVVIANAMDFAEKPVRDASVHREINDLEALGFHSEELDLRDYFGRSEALASRLSTKPLVWVRGGNTFLLRRAMRESGFDAWLLANADDETLVYGGYSAGVTVLGKTLRGLELVDPPHLNPAGYSTEHMWDGLGLIDFSIAPHYKSDHPESEAIDQVVQYLEIHRIEHVTLRDGEVILLPDAV